MLYMLNEESIEMLRRELAKPGTVKPVSMDHHFTVFPPSAAAEWHEYIPPSRANDHLTLSAAHCLIQSLSEQTQSRSELAECRDVMAALERMVESAP